MLHNKIHALLVAPLAALVLTVSPAESQAFCGLFDWLFHKDPVVAPLAANPCPTPTTVAYQPRTSYRLGFTSVPVTRMTPVTSCDPCTGTAVTAYRPTTTYVRRFGFVPYTTYRPVVVPVAAPVATGYAPAFTSAVATGGCASGNCGTPTTYYSPTVSSGSSCCGAGAAPSATYAPAPATTYAPAPATTITPAPATSYAPTPSPTYTPPATVAPQPTPAEQPSTSEPRTFMREPLGGGEPAETEAPQLQPIPDSSMKSSPSGLFRAPQLLDPEDKAAEHKRGVRVIPAVHVQAAESTQEELDAAGWRAAR